MFLDHLAAGLPRYGALRQRSANAEQPRFLKDFSGSCEDGTGVIAVGGVSDAVDALCVVNPAAREHVVSGHESQRGVALREQHLRLAVAAHDDTGGRSSWFGWHSFGPLDSVGASAIVDDCA